MMEDNTDFPRIVIKREFIPEEYSSDNLNDFTVVNIKQEFKSENRITRELVPCHVGGPICQNEPIPLQKMTYKAQFGVLEHNCWHSNSSENYFSDVPLLLARNEIIVKSENQSPDRYQTQSNVYYDSSSIKLVDVSVKLEDLFPANVRKLGKAHSNTKSCKCIYCQKEYRHICDSQYCSTSSPNKKRSHELTTLHCNVKPHKQVKENESIEPLSCRLCQAKFSKRNDLKIHLRIHSIKKNQKCEHCHVTFKYKSHLKFHQRMHSEVKLYKCPHCPAKFKQNSGLHNHKKAHSGQRPFQCKLCSANYQRNETLINHSTVHSTEQAFKYEQYPSELKLSSNIKEDLKKHTVKSFKCSRCCAKFKYSSLLKIHSRVHSDERPFKCHQCPAKFKASSALYVHLRRHSGERPFKCDECPAKFKTSSVLYVHLRRHSGERPFKCYKCPANFTTSSSFYVHLRVHSGEKPFKCHQCPAKFTTSSVLYVHLRTHSGERPYKCPLCSAKFKTSSGLNVHLKVHSGERPFKCPLCPKTYRQSGSLNHHLKLHHREKAYKCNLCLEAFWSKTNLQSHLKTMHYNVRLQN